jgi:hypothetical protein
MRYWKKTIMAKRIGEFDLIDHGAEASQYFQGCGVAFTGFENVGTGIGDNPAEAIDGCLEQVAQAGFETEGMEARIMAQEGWEALVGLIFLDNGYTGRQHPCRKGRSGRRQIELPLCDRVPGRATGF